MPAAIEDAATGDQYMELAELAGRLIHEIKNHLGTVSLNLQILVEDLQNPETPRERRAGQRVQRLLQECQRLADLSNDFLRFAQVKELKRTSTDLKEIVEEMVDFHGPTIEQANIEMRSFVPANLPRVSLDRDLFKQAMLNLILNAQQSMPKGGQITVQAESAGSEVQLSFIDTGVGIPAEHQAKIFRPFFSTRSGGSGLGLPTTRKIVEAHGGRIEVQSEPGRGTKFTLFLPIERD
jgi:two-component system, NtrC family, sensor histidine kinase HydH